MTPQEPKKEVERISLLAKAVLASVTFFVTGIGALAGTIYFVEDRYANKAEVNQQYQDIKLSIKEVGEDVKEANKRINRLTFCHGPTR